MSDQQKKGGAAAAGQAAGKKEEEKKEETKEPAAEDLNEEDQQLKEKLELLVERLSDKDKAQRVNALSQLKQEITGSTKTMTAVPKPLKFLSAKFTEIKSACEAETDASLKA